MYCLRVWVLSLLMAGFVFGVSAQAAEGEKESVKRQKIVSMMEATHVMDTIDAIVPQMIAVRIQKLRNSGQNIPPNADAIMATAVSKVMKANLRPYLLAILNLYDEMYNAQEIDDLLVFYTSPTGQKVLATMPQLMSKTMEVAIKWEQTLGPQLEAEIESAFTASVQN